MFELKPAGTCNDASLIDASELEEDMVDLFVVLVVELVVLLARCSLLLSGGDVARQDGEHGVDGVDDDDGDEYDIEEYADDDDDDDDDEETEAEKGDGDGGETGVVLDGDLLRLNSLDVIISNLLVDEDDDVGNNGEGDGCCCCCCSDDFLLPKKL